MNDDGGGRREAHVGSSRCGWCAESKQRLFEYDRKSYTDISINEQADECPDERSPFSGCPTRSPNPGIVSTFRSAELCFIMTGEVLGMRRSERLIPPKIVSRDRNRRILSTCSARSLLRVHIGGRPTQIRHRPWSVSDTHRHAIPLFASVGDAYTNCIESQILNLFPEVLVS